MPLCYLLLGHGLQFSVVAIRIVTTIGDDEMVEKVETHYLARLLHTLGYAVVVAAGMRVIAGMIVAEGHHGSIAEHSLATNHAPFR